MSRTTDRIPEDRVPGILARAAELDRDRRETITVDAIRAAALDAGINPSAVDAALAEYARDESVPTLDAAEARQPRFARIRGFFRRVGSALKTPAKLGLAFGVLGVASAIEPALVASWLAWVGVALLLMRKHRPARRAAPYVLALAFMTVGLACGFGIAGIDDDLIGILLTLSLPLLAIGILAIKVRLPRRLRTHRHELEAGAG